MCRSVELRHWFIQLRLIASSILRCWAYILMVKVISITLFFLRIFASSLLWERVWILQPVEDLTFFFVPLLNTQTDSCACPWGCYGDGLLPTLGSHSPFFPQSSVWAGAGHLFFVFPGKSLLEEIPHMCQHERSSSQWKLQKKNIFLKLSLPFSIFVIPRASFLSGHWTLFSGSLIHHPFNPCLWNLS